MTQILSHSDHKKQKHDSCVDNFPKLAPPPKKMWLCCCNVGCQPQGVAVASVENKLQLEFLLRLLIADRKSIQFRFKE